MLLGVCYSDYQVYIMRYVPYVGFKTYRLATVITRLYFKRLMFMQMFCVYIYIYIYKKKKKKKTCCHKVSQLPLKG
jgi:cbb3-type cytochrome oxidase subunit 3